MPNCINSTIKTFSLTVQSIYVIYLCPFFQLLQADPVCIHIALIVSPLKSLMSDQVRQCCDMGIKAVVMTKQDDMTTSHIKGSSSNSSLLMHIGLLASCQNRRQQLHSNTHIQ